MGTFLSKHQDFSDIYSVKSVYKALFPNDKELHMALSDENLRFLSLRRNLIVHQRGLIDETYLTSAKCAQPVSERLQLTPNDLEAHLTITVKAAIAVLGTVSRRI